MGYEKQTGPFVLPLILALFTASCRSQTASLPPEEIIARSASRMAAHTGFEFLVEREGAPAFLDVDKTISFRRAEGQFISPDRAQTNARIIAPGLVAEMQIISIGDLQWETNILSGEWQPSDPRYSFNPSLLFNPQLGIPSVLAAELANPVLLGLEELPETPGLELYALQADLQGATAHRMTFGMIDDENLTVRLWIEPETFNLHRIVLVDPADPGEEEETLWRIDFWNFGGAFDIQPPSLTPQSP